MTTLTNVLHDFTVFCLLTPVFLVGSQCYSVDSVTLKIKHGMSDAYVFVSISILLYSQTLNHIYCKFN